MSKIDYLEINCYCEEIGNYVDVEVVYSGIRPMGSPSISYKKVRLNYCTYDDNCIHFKTINTCPVYLNAPNMPVF